MFDRDLTLEEFEILAAEILNSNNTLRFRARGVSMRPFLWDGDLLEVHTVLPGSLRRGDIVLCRLDNGSLLTHRIIKKIGVMDQWKLLIQGDALFHPDGWITPKQVLGRVANVIHKGHVFCVDLPLIIILVWLYMGLAPIRRRLQYFTHSRACTKAS